METSINQVRGATKKEWPLFLWAFLLAAVAWELWAAPSTRREGECGCLRSTTGAASAPAHTRTHGCSRKTESRFGTWKERRARLLLELKLREVMPSDSSRKIKISSMNRFALPNLCRIVWGVAVLVIKKPFADRIFSSRFL